MEIELDASKEQEDIEPTNDMLKLAKLFLCPTT